LNKKSISKIFWLSLALLLCTYFTRKLFTVPFWGAAICLIVFILVTAVTLFLKKQRVGQEYLSAKEVSAFRMFDKMHFFAKVAFYLVVLSFFNSVLLDSEQSLRYALVYLFVCFASIAGTLLFVYYAFAKKVANYFDVINVFIFGCAVWIFASVLMYYHLVSIMAIGYLFACVGIGLIYAALRHTQQDMQEAMELLKELDDTNFNRFASYSDTKALLFAQIVIFAVMAIFSDPLYAPGVFSDIIYILPAVFLIFACIFACLQPLDEKSLGKMVVYRTVSGEEKEKEIIRNSLAQKLVNSKNKIGIRVMKWFVKPCFPCKCIGAEKLKNLDGPVVFVGNHYEIYGPVVAVLRMPVNFRPWVINEMLDDDKIVEQMSIGINLSKLPKFVKKRLPHVAKRFMKYILNAMEPIPVHKGNLREVVTTINTTVEAMQQGDNIMLFPENPEYMYSQGGVDKFYSGFAEIGNSYFKKTGKCTTFFPVYISKKKRKLFIGDGIKFDQTVPKADEKRRIANLLHNSMEKMANEINKKED